MFTLVNPIKKADLSAYVVQSLPCPKCKEVISIEVAPQKLYEYNQGALAHIVLDNYDISIRERFITGFCDSCWNKAFGCEE